MDKYGHVIDCEYADFRFLLDFTATRVGGRRVGGLLGVVTLQPGRFGGGAASELVSIARGVDGARRIDQAVRQCLQRVCCEAFSRAGGEFGEWLAIGGREAVQQASKTLWKIIAAGVEDHSLHAVHFTKALAMWRRFKADGLEWALTAPRR